MQFFAVRFFESQGPTGHIPFWINDKILWLPEFAEDPHPKAQTNAPKVPTAMASG